MEVKFKEKSLRNTEAKRMCRHRQGMKVAMATERFALYAEHLMYVEIVTSNKCQ